jgi:hypothetical protein
MAASVAVPFNWNKIVEKIGKRLRAEYRNQFGKKNQCDLAPEVLAFQSALNEFPCAARILLVECGDESGTSWLTVICHDLSRPRTVDVEFLGVVRQKELDLALLRDYFGIDLASIDEVRPSTFFDDSWSFIVDIVPYHIGEALDSYAQEFYEFLCHSIWHVIQAKFCKTTNYKEKYGVPSDPILPASELLICKMPLANIHTGAPPTIEEWQAMVSDIVLIPQVPDFVNRALDPDRAFIKQDDLKVRITAPKHPEIGRAIYIRPAEGESIKALMARRNERFGHARHTRIVTELPDGVRSDKAIPGVIAEVLRQLEEGYTLDDLRKMDLLQIGSWNIELCF